MLKRKSTTEEKYIRSKFKCKFKATFPTKGEL